jgi:hypothetical protein
MKRLFCYSALILFLLLNSCGSANKHFTEIRGAYIFDAGSGALIKYPSDFMYEENEFLAYSPDDSRTSVIDYQKVRLSLQAHDYVIGGFYDHIIEIAYAVQNNKLILASVPDQMPIYDYFLIGGSSDTLVITVGDENAYLVNLSTGNARKLFNDSRFNNYFNKDSIKNLVFARVISVSPDGRYLLFVSNRNFMDDMQPNHFDLFAIDTHTFIDKNNPGSFLYRELRISADGARTFSPILRHSTEDGRQYMFLNLNASLREYEMLDDEHIYIMRRSAERAVEMFDGHEEIIQTAVLYVANIYTREIFAVDPGRYTTVTNVKMSDTGEYLAFWGSYINRQGVILTEVVTLHIASNDIVSHYEQNVDNYIIRSFYWLPNNVLAVNFFNLTDFSRDACRLHRITHTFRGNAFLDAVVPSLEE